MPYNLLLLFLLYLGFSARSGRRRRLFLMLFAGFYLQANAWLVSGAFRLWEPLPRSVSSLPRSYETGILLTGGLTGYPVHGLDFPQPGPHADRLLATYHLYKAGAIRSVLITGTDHPDLLKQGLGEGQQARSLLISWGIPEGAIQLESRARNTYENALFSAPVLQQRLPADRYLLITSAFHMRRAIGCFQKAGIPVDPFPTGFHGLSAPFSLKRMLLPAPQATGALALLWREWAGFLIYKVLGYC